MAISTLETFDRAVALATADIAPERVAAELARFARAELAQAIASGEASSMYDRYVNGHKGAAEDSVVPPGPILYVFEYWSHVIPGALEELRKRVPVKSGRYSAGFVVLSNGQMTSKFSQIAPSAEVVIINVQPYTRKMETGANRTGRRHFENAKVAVNRRFRGTVSCETRFLDVRSGVHAGVPWILRRSSGRRRDRRAGEPITYPALVLNMVH